MNTNDYVDQLKAIVKSTLIEPAPADTAFVWKTIQLAKDDFGI